MNKSTVMKGKEIIFALSILALSAPTLAGTPKMMVEAQTSTTIRQQMDWLHRIRKINFVYDSSLDGGIEHQVSWTRHSASFGEEGTEGAFRENSYSI